MERYEGPIVPGQANDPGDDQDRPLPTCSVCGALARRTHSGWLSPDARVGVLACGLHPDAPIRWTTRRAIEGDAA